MKTIIGFFVERPLLVNLMMVFILLLGIQSLRTAVYSAYPDLDFGLFSIITPSPGSSPEDIELAITAPLEEEILKVDGIQDLTSSSMEGVSSILVVARDDANRAELDAMGRDLQRALDRASGRLPADLPRNPEMTELNTGDAPVIELLVTGKVSEDLLRDLAKKVEDELRELPGVAGINLKGYRDKEVRILLDPLKMHQLGIDYGEIEQAIRARNIAKTGGAVESFLAEKDVIAVGRFQDPMEVAEVIVRAPQQGNYVRIKDIAEVVTDYEDWNIRSYVNGVHGITINVRKELSANELKVVDRVNQEIEALNTRMPPGVEILVINELSRYTVSMLSMLTNNAIAGMILVFSILILFFPWRSTLWVVVGIPTAVMLGFALMPMFGFTVNQFPLSAIILMLGLLVDDAVVTSESIFRHSERGMPPQQAAIEGTAAVAPPVLTSAATTMLAFMPLVFLGGKEGKFMWMMPAMVVVIVIASLLECKLLLPAHIASSLKKDSGHREMAHWFGRIEQAYKSLISFLIGHRYSAMGLLTLMFVGIMVVGFRTVNVDLYPETDIDVLHIRAELPAGSSFENSYQQLRKVETYVQTLVAAEDLQNTRIQIGTHQIGRPHEVDAGRQAAWGVINIYLEPMDKRKVSSLELIATLREELPRFGQFESLQVLADFVGPPVGYPVEVEVITNGEERGHIAAELLGWLRQQPGVVESWTSFDAGKDIINLQLNHDAIAAYGLTVSDISKAIRVAFDGYIIDELQTVGERIKYRLQLQDPHRGNAETLQSLTIVNRAGARIPLRALAEFEIQPGESSIKHYFGKRTETVFAELDRDVTSVAAINAALADYIDRQQFEQRYPSLRLRQGGELISQDAVLGNLAGALVVVLVAIFFVMVLLFNSLSQPLIVMAMVPLGFAGVVLAFSLQGYDLSMTAFMGTLGLAGVLVNASIVMIDQLNKYRNEEGLVSRPDIVTGALYRLRPILITTLTTVAGLAPAAYGWLGSSPTITPMIMAMLWGVAFGSLITLLYLPCLYAVEQDIRGWLRHRRQGG